MNWKKLLYFNLADLWHGAKPDTPDTPALRDMWFVRIFFCFSRSHKPGPLRSAPLDTREYIPGGYYKRVLRKSWPGPWYLSANRWQRDLLKVTNELAAIAKTNASLTKGLEMAAREQRRLSSGLYSVQLWALTKACSIAIVCMFIGLYLAFNAFDFLTIPALLSFFGMNLIGLLLALVVLHRSRPEEAIFLVLRDHLAAGQPLSEAMRQMHRFFPSFYADLVKAGEDSGNLGECLDQITESTLRSISLSKTLWVFVVYLGGVFAIQCTLLTFLMVKVFPIFDDIIHEFGGEMTGLARLAQHVLEFTIYGPFHLPMAAIAITSVGIIFFAWARRRNRRHVALTRTSASFLLLLPYVRHMVVQQNIAAISTILEKLLRVGMPLDKALESAANASIHPCYRRMLMHTQTRILQGETLTDALGAETSPTLMPRGFVGFVSIGERSGMLPEALARIAAIYTSNVDKQIRILTEAVLPFGVIALGALTLTAELTLFTTMTALYDSLLASM